MKKLLFPHRYQRISGIIFYLSLLIGGWLYFSDSMEAIEWLTCTVPNIFKSDNPFGEGASWISNNITDELLTVIIIVSGVVHSFSREKEEDELTGSLRTEALTWSMLVNYALVLLATLLIFGLAFWHVMVFHLFNLLVLFNLRLRYLLHKHYRG
jgi:hypothetical protein